MFLRWRVLVCAIAVLSILDLQSVNARKSFGSHSYPKSGGLSGGGHHSYPKSGGLSGGGHGYPSSGGSHGYPSSGGMSGSSGSHGYPSSGGSHGYPSSGGMSGSGGSHGYPSSGGSHGYPSSGGSHGYPSSGGSHGYPSSGGGLSGNSHGYPSGKSPAGTTHTTNIYNNYHYSPPKQVVYRPPHGGAPVSYPVYHGQPPTYVYQYKNSGSKYGTLLTGLALLNLGALAGTAYAVSHSNSNSHYKPQPGEICKFGVRKDNGEYEETRIDCQLITSFIYQEQAKTQSPTNTTITTTTVTNVTMVNSTNGAPDAAPATVVPGNIIYSMLPNGTLVPLNGTSVNTTANATTAGANNTMSTSVTVTTTTTNTTVTNALDVKGKPIDVTPGMTCYVIRHTPTSDMRKPMPCGVLKNFADSSLKPNSAARNAPAVTILAIVFAVCLMY